MANVPSTSILRDPRFSIEEDWEGAIVPAVEEAKSRGLMVTPVTVFNPDGSIRGWNLHGWERPPPVIIYTSPPPGEKPYIPNWVI